MWKTILSNLSQQEQKVIAGNQSTQTRGGMLSCKHRNRFHEQSGCIFCGRPLPIVGALPGHGELHERGSPNAKVC